MKNNTNTTTNEITNDTTPDMQYSQLRESVFSWYDFRRDASVLVLGENDDSMEKLFRRRCSEVVHLSGDDYKKDGFKGYSDYFDYIAVRHFPDGRDEPEGELMAWMDCLKEDGHLLLVVENRYGLKYFCGAKDPYTGVVYDGVNNYLRGSAGRGRCYSRNQVKEILKKAGCDNFKFYYPLPDSSMPQLILTDEYNSKSDFMRLNDYNYRDESMLGVEHRIFGEMVENGALPFMANSFIIEIAKADRLLDIDYAVITADRGETSGYATTVHHDGFVRKRPLWEQGKENLLKLHENTQRLVKNGVPVIVTKLEEDECGLSLTMPFCGCENLTSVLKKFAVDDRLRFLDVFDRIYDYIYMASGNERQSLDEADTVLKYGYLDLAPCNAFYNHETGEPVFYDQEFVMESCPAGFAMFRTLKYFYDSARETGEYISLDEMYARYGITAKRLDEYEKMEKKFISGLRNTSRYQKIFEWSTPDYDRIYDLMKKATDAAKKPEKPYKVGYVPGVYDLFHTGHLRLLERCKERCEYLIVGVLTDELVEYYKGKPPVISYENRAGVIAGLAVVDEVIPVDFTNTDKIKAWEQLHYDCHFSGDDHVGHWNDVCEELKKRGSNMEFFSYTKGISSTSIKEKLQGNA